MPDINTPRDTTFNTTESTPRNIADAIAEELAGIAGAIGNIGTDDYDDLSHRPQINSVTLTGDKSANDLSLATQEDLTSIKATGTTNATGSTITSGTYFYLNGTLCKAKVDIASGATFTLNTNYEVVTAGGLNSLNSALGNISSILATKPAVYGGVQGKTIYYDNTVVLLIFEGGWSNDMSMTFVKAYASSTRIFTAALTGTVITPTAGASGGLAIPATANKYYTIVDLSNTITSIV